MIGFIGRRLLELLPVVLIASMAIFGMIYAIPGGPVAGIVGENATPEQIAEVTRRLGLDRPFLVQYADWLGRAVAGDLGQSLHSREPVTRLIGQRLPATLQLALVATIFGLLFGIPVAVASALRPGSLARSNPERMERSRARRPDILVRHTRHSAVRGDAALAAVGLGLCAVLAKPRAKCCATRCCPP